jgi:hypothetical protein
MDADHEFAKFKLLLFGIGLFVVSTFMSCSEIRYSVWGKTVDTPTYTKQQVRVYRRRSPDTTEILVKYQFDDNGKLRKEEDQVSLDYTFASPNTVRVQYIPGSDSSRLERSMQWWWLAIFGGSIGVMGFGAFKFWRFYKS